MDGLKNYHFYENHELAMEGHRYRLKLTSKKLKSGKCQVKFYATIHPKRQLYGYVLVEAGDSLRKVVRKITDRLDLVKSVDNCHHINLYSIGKKSPGDTNFIVFES